MPLMNHILLKDYIEDSKSAVHHCGGIPLALEVLGSSLSCHSIDFWRRALLEPQAIGDGKIQRILRISYDSLQDERHKSLFLDIACFSIGTDKYYLKKIIEGCDFYRITGIQKLIDKCLITIDKDEEVMMHQLLRDMGRETVRQESPEDPGKLSRLWRHKDALSVLRKNTVQGYFNLELIRDVDSEIKNNMHLFNVESVKGIEVEMVNSLTQTYNITPPQVYKEQKQITTQMIKRNRLLPA
ncbi:hypothetical protein JCGZ_20182 [Jatropha curcas]|uniref:Disease resistance protein Roq1-like winged-helix domain-containing protein n=1 Tax=Jatropha curcas TaxID=180498 RepID=A0A067JX39_JATCU|nr:hypothetical protein JCGZ_20182 [Jatropha curcas]